MLRACVFAALLHLAASFPSMVRSIGEIQNTWDPETCTSDFVGKYVTFVGTVTAVDAGAKFWVQDGNVMGSGIAVKDSGEFAVMIGDEVKVTCEIYEEFYMTECTPDGHDVDVSTICACDDETTPPCPPTPIPIMLEPEMISLDTSTCNTDMELYEGMLVTIPNVLFGEISEDCEITAIYDELEYTHGMYNDPVGANITISSVLFDACSEDGVFEPKWHKYKIVQGSVTGVLEFYDGAYAVMPRSADDYVFASVEWTRGYEPPAHKKARHNGWK